MNLIKCSESSKLNKTVFQKLNKDCLIFLFKRETLLCIPSNVGYTNILCTTFVSIVSFKGSFLACEQVLAILQLEDPFCSIPFNLFSSQKIVDLPATFVYVYMFYNFASFLNKWQNFNNQEVLLFFIQMETNKRQCCLEK